MVQGLNLAPSAGGLLAEKNRAWWATKEFSELTDFQVARDLEVGDLARRHCDLALTEDREGGVIRPRTAEGRGDKGAVPEIGAFAHVHITEAIEYDLAGEMDFETT